MGVVFTVHVCSEFIIVETLELSFASFDCLHIYISLLCLSFYVKQCLSIKVQCLVFVEAISCQLLDFLSQIQQHTLCTVFYLASHCVQHPVCSEVVVVTCKMSCKLILRPCVGLLRLTAHIFLSWCLKLHCPQYPKEAGSMPCDWHCHHGQLPSPHYGFLSTIYQSKNHSDWNKVLSFHPEMLNMF